MAVPVPEWRRRLTAPWTDRSGKFSLLKAAFLVLVVAPGAWLAIQFFRGELQPLPEMAIVRETGLWAIRFLMLTLAVTPLRKILAWPKLISVRRMLGIAALAYTSLHMLAWIADLAYDWGTVGSEIVMRLYLTVGTVALVIMIPLGVTSTDAMVRRLGGPRWRLLHMLIYGVGVLAILHFYLLLEKLTTPEAQVLVGLFVWMMAWRLLKAWRGTVTPVLAATLAVASGFATMGIEILYYEIFTTLDAARYLWAANWTLDGGLRAGWIVMAAGIFLAGIAWWRARPSRRAGRPDRHFLGPLALPRARVLHPPRSVPLASPGRVSV